MPKIVDHDAQRERFAVAAMRLMARHGLEGVTMRAVAAEAQLSYGSLFHYFDSKDALLLHAVQFLAQQQTRRVNEYQSQFAGLKALQHLLCDDAIVNDSSRDSCPRGIASAAWCVSRGNWPPGHGRALRASRSCAVT